MNEHELRAACDAWCQSRGFMGFTTREIIWPAWKEAWELRGNADMAQYGVHLMIDGRRWRELMKNGEPHADVLRTENRVVKGPPPRPDSMALVTLGTIEQKTYHLYEVRFRWWGTIDHQSLTQFIDDQLKDRS